MSVSEPKRCLHCRKVIGSFVGRGLCWKCYKTHVTDVLSRGETPIYPALREFTGIRRRKPIQSGNGSSPTLVPVNRRADRRKSLGAVREAALATMGPKSLGLESVFWAHVCWLSEELGVNPRDMFTFNPEKAERLHDYDPGFRMPLNSDVPLGTDYLAACSIAAFGETHPLVKYLGTLIALAKAQSDLAAIECEKSAVVGRIQDFESAIVGMRESYIDVIRGEEELAVA